jgi:hypothetical protein
MASASLRFEDRLDGASNFLSWKVRVTLLLEENDLWDIVKDVVPSPTDPQQLAAHKKKEVKAKRMIMDAIKDHLIPHISEKKMAKEMFDALVSLYQSENINRKMILRNKLRSIEMTRSDSVTSYLMKVTCRFVINLQQLGRSCRCRASEHGTEWIPNFMGTICQRYLCS